jgi:hypothetical protein
MTVFKKRVSKLLTREGCSPLIRALKELSCPWTVDGDFFADEKSYID